MNSKNVKLVSVLIGVLLVSMAYSATVVSVDPADRLMNKVLLGEWNTAGNLEGWTGTSVSGLTATGGNLQGTGTAATPTVQKTSTSGWPDLDFGYYDYLQIRIRVPSGFTSDVGFSFGTSVNTGFATSREFTIPNASLVKDNALHAYRLDLGLDMFWRNTLRDMQIKPLGSAGNGVTFYIDYIEVGDLPGDTLSVNTDGLNIYAGETLAQCSRVESKHGCFWYSPQSSIENPGFSSNVAVFSRRALRMLEESYQVYLKVLNLTEPCQAVDGSPTGRWKTNHITWYSGFWMGGDGLGFGYYNVPGYGLGDEGWGNPCPHEYGHCWEMHAAGNLAGGHWESFANVLQNWRNMHFSDIPEMGGHPTCMNGAGNDLSALRQDHGRLIYSDFRIHLALQYYPGAGNPADLMSQVWKNGSSGMTIYDKLATIITGGASAVPDTVTSGLRHHGFLDFGSDSAKLKTGVWDTSLNKEMFWYRGGSYLVPCQDKSGWWRVPAGKSPETYSYVMHKLTPSSTNVTVELRGMDVIGSTEGWRWSLAEVDSSDVVRYSNIFSPGTQSWTMNSTSNRLYLIVVATPTNTTLNLEFTDDRLQVDKCADRLHYGYEVRLVNCTPATTGNQLNVTESGGHAHSNGGGYVGPSANVASTAYVGPNARVLGTSDVLNYARIEDYAVIMGNATVQDYAVVSGYAVVTDNAIVKNYAKVRDRACVGGWPTTVQSNAVIQDFVNTWDNQTITDSVIARGQCAAAGSGTWSGTAIAEYDITGYAFSDGCQFSHVPWGDWYQAHYVDSKKKPRGLVASYRTEETEGEMWWDEFGTVHGLLRGTPERVEDSTFNSKVMRFDGTTEWAALERGLSDTLAGSISLWVKPDDNTDRPILFMGSSATKYLKLALNASAYAVFTISNGTTTNTVTSTSTIPTGSWTHLAVTVSGTQLKIYVNAGTPQATTSSTIVPDDVLGSNDYTNADGMYIGRDWAGALYDGDLEDVRIYNVAMTDAEVANEKRRCGNVVGALYWDASKDFNGSSTTDESGIHDGVVRYLEAEIYPHTSDNVAYYEGIFDSSDELDGGFQGSGFGLDAGKLIVRLENVGFWDPNVTVSLNTWQKVSLAFNGSQATLFVNSIERGNRNYSCAAADVAGKNYRIGYASDTTPTKYYFDGLIRNLRILDTIPPGTFPATPTPLPTNTPMPYQVSDNFNTARNYLTQGVSGTIWSGFLGLGAGETVDALDANTTQSGRLYIASTNGVWAEGWNPLGPFLYRDVTGDFVATVKVTDYQDMFHNNCGIMARAKKSPDEGGTGEDWVSIDYFPIWGCGNYVRSADNDVRTENCTNGLAFGLDPWLRLERLGNVFHMYTSSDGAIFTEMSCSPLTRSDLNGLTLQVGLFQATYSADQGYVSFDDFVLNYVQGGGPTNTPTNTPTTGPSNTPTRTPTNTPTSTPTRTPEYATYNFVGINQANTDYNAYACDVDVFPFAGSTANRNTMVEATDAQYTSISVNDTSRWTTANPGTSDEIFLWVEMKVNQDPSDITNIELTHVGYAGGTSATTYRMYVKDKAVSWEQTSAWIKLGTDQSFPAGSDSTMTRSVTSNFAQYIDANSKLTFGVYETRSNVATYINFLRMVVAH